MRPSTNEYFLSMAKLVATRSTCFRRQVGCVLVDASNRVLATGYNGVTSGMPHCNHANSDGLMPYLCSGALSMSGTNLAGCRAIHAEANALISCRNPEDVRSAYVTVSPCNQCVDFLLNTPCRTIVFIEPYAHVEAKDRWTRNNREWIHLPI